MEERREHGMIKLIYDLIITNLISNQMITYLLTSRLIYLKVDIPITQTVNPYNKQL